MSLVRMLVCAFYCVASTGAHQISFAGQASQAAVPPVSKTPADQKCILSGKVSNSITGEPLRKVAIKLLPRGGWTFINPSGSFSPGQYSTTSQADGSFEIQNIEPGNYVLSGERTGYLHTQFGAKHPLLPGAVLTLQPGQQKTGLNLPLVPQAVITGKVMDEDGDPVNGATVQVVRHQRQQGRKGEMTEASTQTNDLGEFRLAGLRPGKFYLFAEKLGFEAADSELDRRPVKTFYPEAISREAAAPVEAQAGQDLPGMNIRMRVAQTYHVRGKVAGVVPEGDGEPTFTSVRANEAEHGYAGMQSIVGKAHTFDIAGFAPGSYELVVQSMNGKNRSEGHQQIEVGTGDLNDVLLNVQAPTSMKGIVRLEGGPSGKSAATNLSNIHINLMPVDGMVFGQTPNAKPGPEGTFTLESVSASKYKLNVNASDGTYVKSVKVGGQEVRGKYLDFSRGAAGELEIVLRYGAAEVSGSVQAAQNAESSGNSSGEAALSATIMLVPEEVNEDGSGVLFNSTDPKGTFTLKQVPPGRYKAYALEEGTFEAVENPDVLKQIQSKGMDLEVKENDIKQIQLPLISAEEFQQVLAKLGLEPS